WGNEAGVEIVPVNSAREACGVSDFSNTATNAPQAVVKADWLEPGQFITGVKDQELEMTGWEKCDQVVVNRHGAFWQRYAIGGVEVIPEHGADRIGKPSEKINWSEVPILGDVVTGKHPGRTSDDQIIGNRRHERARCLPSAHCHYCRRVSRRDTSRHDCARYRNQIN